MLSWVEISRSAIEHNLKAFRNLIGPSVLLIPVVKANAYGHGILEVARICEETAEVDRLAVVNLDEALLLRAGGIKKPIQVLSFYPLDEDAIIEALKKNREKNRKFHAKFRIHTSGSIAEDVNNYRFNITPELKLNFWGFDSTISYELPLDIQMKSFAGNNALKFNAQKRLFGANWWINYYTQKESRFNIVELGGEKSVRGYNLRINQAFDLDGDTNKTSLSAETVLYKKYGLGLNGNYDWINNSNGANFFIKFKF